MKEPTNGRVWKCYRKWCRQRGLEPSLKGPKEQFAKKLGVSKYTLGAWFRPSESDAWRRAPVMAARLAESIVRD
jgi:hypothetical protein